MFSGFNKKHRHEVVNDITIMPFTGFKKLNTPIDYQQNKSYEAIDVQDTNLFINNHKRIVILWATVRPNTFKTTHTHWIEQATLKSRIRTIVAVDTHEQANELMNYGVDVMVTNNTKPGVCFPSYCLSLNVQLNDNDIVIFASDDFFPPIAWDMFVYSQLDNESEKILIVNDGIQGVGTRLVTIPIMTSDALIKMNRVIYHPVYNHLQSDVELYDVAERLGMIKDVRPTENIIFEHRHHSIAKRELDIHDRNVHLNEKYEMPTYVSRKNKSISDMTAVDSSIQQAAKSVTMHNDTTKKISILICTTTRRKRLLDQLLNCLVAQLTPNTNKNVEIVIESDDDNMSIAAKRNVLLDRSIHDYICFVDDDDIVSGDYIYKVIAAIQNGPDCCSMLGVSTLDGHDPIDFYQSIHAKDKPNHRNVIRRDIATLIRFDETLSSSIDSDFTARILPHLKYETDIDGIIYKYQRLTHKDNHIHNTNVDKKIISFSLWGSNPFYTEGVVKNCAMASQFYPGWIVWVYVNDTVPQSIIDKILAFGAMVINVGGTDTSAWGMMWRFLPSGDPTVAAFMSRDGDSRFTLREAKLVQEWMDSDKELHLIRDHKEHGLPFLGGMWGVKRGRIATLISTEMSSFRAKYETSMNSKYAHNNMKNTDQDFLQTLIYPHTDGCRIVHVSDGLFVDGDIRIPPAPDGNFIGKPVDHDV